MKKTIKHLASVMAAAMFLFIALGSDDEETSVSSSSPDGTYTSTVSGGGPGGQFSVSINGGSWSSVLKLNSYDNGNYDYGSVRGKDLYDESGFVKVGYVSGNTVTIGRFSASK